MEQCCEDLLLDTVLLMMYNPTLFVIIYSRDGGVGNESKIVYDFSKMERWYPIFQLPEIYFIKFHSKSPQFFCKCNMH